MTESDGTLMDVDAIDDVDEATVVVDRDSDETVVVERTRVRRPEDHAAAADGEDGEDDDESTVVVARGGGAASDDDEATRVVARGQTEKPLTHPAEQIMKAPTRRDRRRPAPAPVSEDVLRTAEPGIGPGLAEHYAARRLPAAEPTPQPVLEPGPPPSRDVAAALPSVARRSRRSAAVAIAAFAAACLVTVVGLGAVVVTALATLFG